MTPVERIIMLGVPLARLGMSETVEWIDQAIATRAPHQVATANVNFLALGRRDAGFLRVLQDASLVTCDGMPLVWASRLLGRGAGLPERVPGSDLVPRLCDLAARRGYRLFLMGSRPSTEEAARRLTARYTGLQIAGTETPPYGPIETWENAAYCARIRKARTDLLLVGFGAPKQDWWIARYLRDTGAPVAIGVGATFDYIAGRVRRAPGPIRAMGLEWAWRIAAEPRRLWRRYVRDAVTVAPRLARQILDGRAAERRARHDPPARVRLDRTGAERELFVLSLEGSLPADRLPLLRGTMRGLRQSPAVLVLDLTGATFLAPAVLGELVALTGWVRASDGVAALVAPPAIRHHLVAAGVDGLAPAYPTVAEAVSRLAPRGERRVVFAAGCRSEHQEGEACS